MKKIVALVAVLATWFSCAIYYAVSGPTPVAEVAAAEADAAALLALPQDEREQPEPPPAESKPDEAKPRLIPGRWEDRTVKKKFCDGMGRCYERYVTEKVWIPAHYEKPEPAPVHPHSHTYPKARYSGKIDPATGQPQIYVKRINGVYPPTVELEGALWDLGSDGLYSPRKPQSISPRVETLHYVEPSTVTYYEYQRQPVRRVGRAVWRGAKFVGRAGWRVVTAPVRFFCRRCRR